MHTSRNNSIDKWNVCIHLEIIVNDGNACIHLEIIYTDALTYVLPWDDCRIVILV